MWALAAIEKGGKVYLFFSANDVQRKSGPLWDESNDINHYGGKSEIEGFSFDAIIAKVYTECD